MLPTTSKGCLSFASAPIGRGNSCSAIDMQGKSKAGWREFLTGSADAYSSTSCQRICIQLVTDKWRSCLAVEFRCILIRSSEDPTRVLCHADLAVPERSQSGTDVWAFAAAPETDWQGWEWWLIQALCSTVPCVCKALAAGTRVGRLLPLHCQKPCEHPRIQEAAGWPVIDYCFWEKSIHVLEEPNFPRKCLQVK